VAPGKWSAEYPDAKKFRRQYVNTIAQTEKGMVIQDYGLDSEEVLEDYREERPSRQSYAGIPAEEPPYSGVSPEDNALIIQARRRGFDVYFPHASWNADTGIWLENLQQRGKKTLAAAKEWLQRGRNTHETLV